MKDPETMGALAYQAYGAITGHKNYQGLPMPTWEELTPTIRSAWIYAAQATVRQYMSDLKWDHELEFRETEQIRHAQMYARSFHTAGIPGHSQLLLIAKLAKGLGLIYFRSYAEEAAEESNEDGRD